MERRKWGGGGAEFQRNILSCDLIVHRIDFTMSILADVALLGSLVCYQAPQLFLPSHEDICSCYPHQEKRKKNKKKKEKVEQKTIFMFLSIFPLLNCPIKTTTSERQFDAVACLLPPALLATKIFHLKTGESTFHVA